MLKHNDVLARELRTRFEAAGVFVVSLVSSPGAGKTEFLEKTLTRLKEKFQVAALVGDLETANDAARLARAGVPVKQIMTGTICHLEAQMIEKSLADWNLNELDFLFIENVGNLVCFPPTSLSARIVGARCSTRKIAAIVTRLSTAQIADRVSRLSKKCRMTAPRRR